MVVPSFYLIMDDLSRVLTRLFARVIGPKEAEPVDPSPQELSDRINALEVRQPDQSPPTLRHRPGLAAE